MKAVIKFLILLSLVSFSVCSYADTVGVSVIQFHYVAAALVLAGVLLMLFEVLLTSFGALGVLGTLLLCFGLYKMLNPASAFYHLSIIVVLAFGIIAIILFLLFGWFFIKLRHKKVVTGQEELLGAEGEVVLKEHGMMALIHGELWQIQSDVDLQVGQIVKVVSRHGLILVVKPYKGS